MASRELNTALLNTLEDEVFRPFIAIDLEFDGNEQLNMWTGPGDATIDGKTYVGVGNLLSLGEIEETSEIVAPGATLTLSGMPTALIQAALAAPYQGRRCTIYIGSLDSPTAYTEIFSGDMDVMTISRSAETCTIQLDVQNRLVTLDRPRVRRYNSANHKSRYPNDLGFDFVEAERDVVWGPRGD